MPKRAAIYLRVSTQEQSTDAQRAELEAVAARAGWEIVEVYEDAGISGTKGRDKRPAFDRVLRDATRRRFDIVAAWALDRIGRSLQHLVPTLAELKAAGVDLYLHQQAIDITTPSGKAFYGMLGVFAEFERDMIAARVQAGIDRQRAHLLAQRTGTEVAIGAAAIDRVIAVRSGIAQAHPPPAASAYGDALQQCAAAARRTGTAPIPPG